MDFRSWTSPQVGYGITHTYPLNNAQAPSGHAHSNIIISSQYCGHIEDYAIYLSALIP